MHVLFTNLELSSRSGTTLFIRDFALELQRRGHTSAVFTLQMGAVSEELQGAGIGVVRNLRALPFAPEIIHGHHFATTLAAVRHFLDVPAIYVCHGHDSWADRTPLHDNIRRYYGVSQLCVDRLLKEGATPDQTGLLLNFVDTRRFLPRDQLPPQPERALLFSNYAHPDTQLPAVKEACRLAGLELDVVGARMDNPISRPEHVLPMYDLVFAKGRAAIESMAVGTSVVLCDFAGVGPMVSAAEVQELRSLNFGFQALRQPLQAESILRQIRRYDPLDATKVRDQIRSMASLDRSVRDFVRVYEAVIRERGHSHRAAVEGHPRSSVARERLFLQLSQLFTRMNPSLRSRLKRLPIVGPILAALKRGLLRTS